MLELENKKWSFLLCVLLVMSLSCANRDYVRLFSGCFVSYTAGCSSSHT
jgi:hypothetical protein